MSTDEVLYETTQEGIAIITLNRPKRLNAFTMSMQVKYFEYLNKANDDNNIKCIIVTGAGRAFCAGADMDGLQNITKKQSFTGTGSGNDRQAVARGNTAQIQALKIRKPIIGCLNGAAAGLGFVTAMFTDIRYIVQGSKLTSSFSQRGLVAEHGISYILPKIVGISNAIDILCSSRIIYPDEALKMGLVNKVFNNKKEMMKHAMEYAKYIATKCSPAAIYEIKRQLFKNLNDDVNTSWKESIALMLKSFNHPDFKEGVESYVQRRKPKFKGLNAGTISKL